MRDQATNTITVWKCLDCKEIIRIPDELVWPEVCPECAASPFTAKPDRDVKGLAIIVSKSRAGIDAHNTGSKPE